MCRMIAFSSKKEISIDPYLKVLKNMAERGKRSPHGDGWGYFALHPSGIVSVARSAKPIFKEQPQSSFRASLLIAHARKASESMLTTQDQAHPLIYYKNRMFMVLAHNGLLKDAKKSVLGVDTEDVLLTLAENGVEKGVKKLLEREYRALNLLIYDGEILYAFRCAKTNLDYYTLFLSEGDYVVEVASEKFMESMQLLENGEMVKIKRGRVIERMKLDCL